MTQKKIDWHNAGWTSGFAIASNSPTRGNYPYQDLHGPGDEAEYIAGFWEGLKQGQIEAPKAIKI